MANKVVKDFEFPESFGFSGSSGKTMVRAYARGGKAKSDKVGKVMGEFKDGTLHSGKNGPVVKNRKQAIAIALSEAERAKKGHAKGGRVHEDRAEDVKLIREEIKKWEEKEDREEEKDDGEEMKRGGKIRKKKRKQREIPIVRVPPPMTAPNARAVPVFSPEPLVGMKRGGKAK